MLYVRKPVFEIAPTITSDINEKNNINYVEWNALDLLYKLKAISYSLKTRTLERKSDTINEFYESEYGKRKAFDKKQSEQDVLNMEEKFKKDSEKIHYGFIAQDVKDVFPEIIEYDEETGKYGLRYMELIPIIVEAIKLQRNEINTLRDEVKRQNEELLEYKKMEEDRKKTSSLENNNYNIEGLPMLYENTPNPFNKNTGIKYFIPNTAKNASITITSLKGDIIKQIKLNEKGDGQISFSADLINNGVYIYTLWVDGIKIDSKRMLIIE